MNQIHDKLVFLLWGLSETARSYGQYMNGFRILLMLGIFYLMQICMLDMSRHERPKISSLKKWYENINFVDLSKTSLSKSGNELSLFIY